MQTARGLLHTAAVCTLKRLSMVKGGSRKISLHLLLFLKNITLETVPKLAQRLNMAIDRAGSFQAALVLGWLQPTSTHVEEPSMLWCIRELQWSSGEVYHRIAVVLRDKATIDTVEMSNLVWLCECEGPNMMPYMGALCK